MPLGATAAIGQIDSKYPCRQAQIQQLACLLSPDFPRPSNVVVHGLEATGKSSIVKEVAKATKATTVIVDCAECITVRHLLERTTADCVDAAVARSGDQVDRRRYARCENATALNAHLHALSSLLGPLTLVFDGIDRLRETASPLLPALARIADLVPLLTIVYIIAIPGSRLFHHSGVPHVHFPAYERAEVLRIFSRTPKPIFPDETLCPPDYDPEQQAGDDAFLWARFCAALWDSLANTAARDLVSYRTLADKLWPLFTLPVLDGRFGARDFSRLMVANRALFQSDDVLTDRIRLPDPKTQDTLSEQQMPPIAKYIICAAYLASHNPARLDQKYFMQWTEKKRRKRGGRAPGRAPKTRKIPRKALPPSAFNLSRLRAILAAIHPEPIPPAQYADISGVIASLTSARLLVRAGASAANGDPLDERAKWKVNVGWEHVVKLGRSIGFEIQDWCAE